MKFKTHRRFFTTYFADACRNISNFNAELELNTRRAFENRPMFVRSAIIHCALALESAANACLDDLKMQKAAHEDFDKLQTLSKFDLFLAKSDPKKSLDREHKLVRPIRNLITCRNTYVHSKVLAEEIHNGHLLMKTWEPLSLPRNQSYWQPVHAVKVLTSISDFLNYFFFDLCPFNFANPTDRGQVASILGSAVFAEDESAPLIEGLTAAPIMDDQVWAGSELCDKYDLQFGFMGFYKTDSKGIVLPKRQLGDYSHCEISDLVRPQPIVFRTPSGVGVLGAGASSPTTQAAKPLHVPLPSNIHDLFKLAIENTNKRERSQGEADKSSPKPKE